MWRAMAGAVASASWGHLLGQGVAHWASSPCTAWDAVRLGYGAEGRDVLNSARN